MRIAVETVILFSLFNREDEHYRKTTMLFRDYLAKKATFVIPRMAWVESIVHLTRTGLKRAATKDRALQIIAATVDKLVPPVFEIVEHTLEDYREAEAWWRQFADWPIDYPDALIAAAARRVRVQSLWTFDYRFQDFLLAAMPKELPPTRILPPT